VALRFLLLLEINGALHLSYRIGGLLVGDLEPVLEEGGELAEGYWRLVSGGEELEMMVLLAVMRNSVEVQVGEGWSIGVAVYGPQFSWFNHSCAPNAFYRF
jgi:hypothetical protein